MELCVKTPQYVLLWWGRWPFPPARPYLSSLKNSSSWSRSVRSTLKGLLGSRTGQRDGDSKAGQISEAEAIPKLPLEQPLHCVGTPLTGSLSQSCSLMRLRRTLAKSTFPYHLRQARADQRERRDPSASPRPPMECQLRLESELPNPRPGPDQLDQRGAQW